MSREFELQSRAKDLSVELDALRKDYAHLSGRMEEASGELSELRLKLGQQMEVLALAQVCDRGWG